jgi:hypothetical protein
VGVGHVWGNFKLQQRTLVVGKVLVLPVKHQPPKINIRNGNVWKRGFGRHIVDCDCLIVEVESPANLSRDQGRQKDPQREVILLSFTGLRQGGKMGLGTGLLRIVRSLLAFHGWRFDSYLNLCAGGFDLPPRDSA